MATKLRWFDEEVVLRLLLQYTPEKVWSLEDLKQEDHFQFALRFLFAALTGEGRLRSAPTIHVSYNQLHSDHDEGAEVQNRIVGRNFREMMG